MNHLECNEEWANRSILTDKRACSSIIGIRHCDTYNLQNVLAFSGGAFLCIHRDKQAGLI